MSVFNQLYEGLMKNEAGYNPNDQGYPTYNGIRSHNHPTWEGWPVVKTAVETGRLKRGGVLPELDIPTRNFYKNYWRGKGLYIENLFDLKLAQLLVDMCTQHGKWARVINAGLYDLNPFNTTIPNTIGAAEYNTMNAKPAESYLKIAEARLEYCKKVGLQNEGDRKGIINRAQAFVNDALEYLQNGGAAVSAGTIGVVASLFFFS